MSSADPIEWRLYNTDFATVQSILPVAAGATLYLELNEPGSGSVTIPADCAAAALITVNKFIACYYRGAYRGGFLVDDIETVGASSGEHGDNWMKISGRGPLALMSEGIQWAEDGKETSRDFDNKPAAYVVLKLWAEAEQRGALAHTTIDFTDELDSADPQQAWDDLDDHKFANGITVLDVIRDIAKLGFEFSIDFDGAGEFTLHMFKNHIGTDVSGTIIFRTGVNCEEVGENKKSDELKNAMLVKYAGGYTSVKDASSVTSHRRRETLFHADEANASKLGKRWGHAMLGTMKEPKVEVAVKVYDGMPPAVFVDYDMGDTVALDNQGVVTDYRILGMTLTWEHEKASVEVELSSRYTQHDIRVAQDVERLKRLYTQAHDADLLEVSYWSALGDVPWGSPGCMAQIGTKIYAAGIFTHVGNVQANNIACYDTVTGLWSCLAGQNGQNGVDNVVNCLLADGTNLYMGGSFNALGTGDVDDDPGIISYNVGVWDTVGSSWGMINPNPLSGGAVSALEMVDGWLYVGGNFISVWDDYGDPIPDTSGIFKTIPLCGVAMSLGVGQGLISVTVLQAMGLSLYAGGTALFKSYYTGPGGGFWSDVFVGGLTHYPVAMLNVEDLYLYIGNIDTGGTPTGTDLGAVAKFDSVAATWEVLAPISQGACHALATDGLNIYASTTIIGTGVRGIGFTDDSSWYGMGGGAAGNVTGIVCLNEVTYICGEFHTVGGPTGTKKAALHLAAYIGAFYPLIESLEHQAEVQWGEITGDIEDQLDLIAELDKHVNIAQGENSRVVVTSSTGDVTTDADLLYDAANNALTIGSEALPITVANALNVIAASGSLARFGFVFADTLDNSDYDTSVRAGGTFAAPTSILADMVLKKWRGRGYYNNSSGISTTAVEIRAVADGNWSGSSWPTRIEMWTIPVDSVTLTKALTVGSDGILYDGNGDPIAGEWVAPVDPSVIGNLVSFSGIAGEQADSGIAAADVITTGNADWIDLTDAGETALHSHAGGSGHTIMDEGVPLTARANLNFIGAGVTVTDNAGGEVIGDPGFDDPDYWDETNGFTIVGGKAVASGSGYLLQAIDSNVIVPGATYNVSVDVVVNGGILTLETNGETIGTISTTGTHTFSFLATGVSLWLYCDAGDFDGTIDNFSVKTQAATDVTITGNAIPAGNDTNIQFNDGGVLGGDDGFTWDKNTNTLTFAENDGVEPDTVIKGKDSTAPANGGGTLYIQGGAANTSIQNGGDINIQGGANPLGPGGIIFLDNAASLNGGAVIAQAGASTGVGETGGCVEFNAGSNAALSGDGTGGYVGFSGGNGGAPDGDGGNIVFNPGSPQGTGTIGKVMFGHHGGSGKYAIFDLELLLSSDKTFTFPNKDGTFAMVSDLITQNIILPDGMGTPTYDDLYDFLNMTQSSGRLTGGVLTAHTDGGANGTLDISGMEGMIHTANTLGSPLIYFKKAAVAEIALTDLAVNYIWITYTEPGGTPTLTYSANAARPTEDYNVFVVGRCWRSGNDVEVLTTGQNIYNQYGRIQDRMLAKYGVMDHASGSTLAAHLTALRLTCDAGIWYFGNSHIDTGAVSTFHVWYKTGGGAWTESGPFTLFSEVFDGAAAKVYETYQNGTSLGTLSGGKYGVYWIYECPEGDLYVVLGTSDYANIAAAQAATIPASLPPYCQYWSRLIGRVICQKTGAAFYSVESAFVTQFTVSAGAFVPSDRVITATSPITIAGTTSADLSADRTIAIPAATALVPGHATAAQITKLDGIAAGANLYVHPNHSGDVTSAADGAQTIGANKVTLAMLATQAAETVLANATAGAAVPTALALAEQTVLGRITGGHVVGLTAAQIRTLANVADGSQVNVLEGVTGTAPIVAGVIAAKSQAISITAATTGAAGSMSSADKTKLDGIAAGSQSPWVCVKKAADESVQSDTTVTADADLSFIAAASKTYAVRGRAWFSTAAAADFKFRFGFAGTSIFIHEVSIPCGSATETVGIETASPTTTISCLGTGTTGGYLEFDGVLVCDGTPRAFTFQWAQVTSTASNTTVKAGSYLEYLQVD